MILYKASASGSTTKCKLTRYKWESDKKSEWPEHGEPVWYPTLNVESFGIVGANRDPRTPVDAVSLVPLFSPKVDIHEVTHSEAQCSKTAQHASMTWRCDFGQIKRHQTNEHAQTEAVQQAHCNEHANGD